MLGAKIFNTGLLIFLAQTLIAGYPLQLIGLIVMTVGVIIMFTYEK